MITDLFLQKLTFNANVHYEQSEKKKDINFIIRYFLYQNLKFVANIALALIDPQCSIDIFNSQNTKALKDYMETKLKDHECYFFLKLVMNLNEPAMHPIVDNFKSLRINVNHLPINFIEYVEILFLSIHQQIFESKNRAIINKYHDARRVLFFTESID